MKRNEPGIEEGGKIVASNNAKGNVPGIGKGSIFCSEQHWKRNGHGQGGKTAANSHARPFTLQYVMTKLHTWL